MNACKTCHNWSTTQFLTISQHNSNPVSKFPRRSTLTNCVTSTLSHLKSFLSLKRKQKKEKKRKKIFYTKTHSLKHLSVISFQHFHVLLIVWKKWPTDAWNWAPSIKYGIIREYKDETGESQPDARSAEGCDSPCRIRVRALWLHFWHAQIRGQSATGYENRNFSWNHLQIWALSVLFMCFKQASRPQCKGVICQTKFGTSDEADVEVSMVLESQSSWHFATSMPVHSSHSSWRERSTRPELHRFSAVSFPSGWPIVSPPRS